MLKTLNLKKFISKVQEVFKFGDLTDKVNILRWLIAVVVSAFFKIGRAHV